MRLGTRSHSRLLRSVFTFAVLLCTTHANNSIFENFNDLNECTGSDQYLCGCQAVPAAEMAEIKKLLGQELPCEQLCDQRTCAQECDKSVCSVRMGNFGEYCTKTSLDQSIVNFIRSASCSFHQEMLVYECVKGDSVAYPNTQTYNAIIDGYCIPSCGLNVDLFECKFDPWFREETNIKPEDLETPPFTAIAGADPRTTETTEADAELPSGDSGLGPIKTLDSPEEDDKPSSPKPDPLLLMDFPGESSAPAPSEDPEVSEPTQSEPTEAPVEEPQVQPIDEPSTEEKSIPAPAPSSEDVASPAPASEETPAPAPESEETPSPAPASEETPAPAPESDDTPAPAPESEETPSPAPASEETPAPAPESEETPAPAPASEDTPSPAPASEETPAAAPESEEPEQTPDLEEKQEVEETPAPEPEPESLDSEEPPSSERPFVPVVPVVPTTETTVTTLSSRATDTPAASRTSNAEVTYWPIIAGGCLVGLLLIALIAFVVLRRRKDLRKPIATFLRDALPEGQIDEEDPVPSGRYDRMTSEAEQATAPAVISSR